MPARFATLCGALFLLLVPQPGAARTSSLEALAQQFLAEAGGPVRAVVSEGHSVGFVLSVAEDAGLSRLAGRLAERLAYLPPQTGGAGEAKPPVHLLRFPETPAGAPDRGRDIRAARRLGWDRLLRVELLRSEGRVVLFGELVTLDGSVWTQLLHPEGGVSQQFYATRRIDAEIRALLGLAAPPLPSAWKIRPLPSAVPIDGPVLALALGDLEGDGGEEVLVLTARRLLVLRLAGGQLEEAAPPFALSELPPAAVRSRVPHGALLVAPLRRAEGVEVALATSDQAAGVVLCRQDGRLVPCPADEVAVALTCGDQIPRDEIRGRLLACGFPVGSDAPGELTLARPREGRPLLEGPLLRWDLDAGEVVRHGGGPRRVAFAWQRRWVKQADEGAWQPFEAAVTPSHELVLNGRTLSPAGFAAAVGDLNDDGRPEVASASAALPGSPDRVRLAALGDDGELTEIWSAESEPVQAVAMGDVDHDGRVDVLVATSEWRADAVALAQLVPSRTP